MGSPPTGTSTMTLISFGGFLPIEMASMRMRLPLELGSWQTHAMRRLVALSVFCLWPALALASGNTSVYTKFDLDHCKLTEKGDDYVYAGTWTCKGYGGIDMVCSSVDDP